MFDSDAVIAAQLAIGGGDFCASVLRVIPVSGVAVSTMSGRINNETICATDALAFRLDEIQFDLGEGPCWEAFASHRPVLIPDMQIGSDDRWPLFADAVHETAARAMFVFPLYVGATGVGTMALYRTHPGPLDRAALRDAHTLADAVAVELSTRIVNADQGDDAGSVDGIPSWRDVLPGRREIHQATGIVMSQLDLSVGAAFARLQGHAFATSSSLAEVANAVIDHRLHLSRDAT
jgi:hypothetical protein